MLASRYAVLVAAVAASGMGLSTTAIAQEEGSRRIEEVVVTAERRESTVSDTSISITAFSEGMLEDFGIQGADELINFTPSTTRDTYDIRIRGVGRNFRALGGDPGVATYYNGVYSEDFGIAASEGGLYDVARVEVLRGPQGTLYGRNAIGGALNYITNQPSYEPEAEVRYQGGNLGTQEWYGILSGPIIADKLAYRFTGMTAKRDGAQNGISGSEDVGSINDQNLAIALNWRVTDNQEFNIRYNDRQSDRIIEQTTLVSEGTSADRGQRSAGLAGIPGWQYAYGIVPVPGPTFGVPYTGPTLSFTDPATGNTVQGIYARPGIDRSPTSRPNAGWRQDPNPNLFDSDVENLNGDSLTNDENDETFDHHAVQANYSWDINEKVQVKWIGGWSDFDYTFLDDLDNSVSTVTIYDQYVKQSLENYSNELQLLWSLGDKLEVTTGAYMFHQDLRQQYDVRDMASQGRFTRPTNYGALQGLATALGQPVGLGSASVGQQIVGLYPGDSEGRIYAIDNNVTTDSWAVFSQGTYTFNEKWALTLGIRYAKDDKEAHEQRGGRTILSPTAVNAFISGGGPSVYEGFCVGTYGVSCATAGLTDLAVMNVFMGALSGVPTFNPQQPFAPTCALDDQNCLTPVNLDGFPISFSDNSKGKDSWDDVNFRANLDWSPNDNTLIYGSVTTGYRAGGYSLGLLGTQTVVRDANGNIVPGQLGEPRNYNDETVIAYELGYKGSLFDDTLQLFTSAYYYDYSGYQDEVQFPNSAGTGDQVVINAGDATNWGLELEAIWLPTDNWTIGGNYSYTQTEYQDDLLLADEWNFSNPQPLLPIEVVNVKGNDLKRIPEHKYTVYSWYDLNFSPGTLTFGGAYSYTGQMYSTALNDDPTRVRSRFRLDLSATWRDNADHWNIRAFVDNVTDEGSTRQMNPSTAGGNYRLTANYLYPRFYGMDVTYRFGHLL
jgi:iron complex outermembrane receptor protein